VYQRHKPPQEIGQMGHPAVVAGVVRTGTVGAVAFVLAFSAACKLGP
jgi:hypothetical protein